MTTAPASTPGGRKDPGNQATFDELKRTWDRLRVMRRHLRNDGIADPDPDVVEKLLARPHGRARPHNRLAWGATAALLIVAAGFGVLMFPPASGRIYRSGVGRASPVPFTERPLRRAPAFPRTSTTVTPSAKFTLKDGLYVTSADLLKALQAKRRIVLLDTRAMSQWQMAHIEGSVPVPPGTTDRCRNHRSSFFISSGSNGTRRS